MVASLRMQFELLPDSRVQVTAPWLSTPVVAKTFLAAWEEALRRKPRP